MSYRSLCASFHSFFLSFSSSITFLSVLFEFNTCNDQWSFLFDLSLLLDKMISDRTLMGIYIFPINWIFLHPPPFSKIIFFPVSAVKISPFSRFSTPFPIIFAFLPNKSSHFFPNQPKTHISPKIFQIEKYTPLTTLEKDGENVHNLHSKVKIN